MSRIGVRGVISVVLCLFVAGAVSGCPAREEAGFVGNNTCLSCHNGFSAPDQRAFLASEHAQFDCESCHGPGLAHVRAAGRGGLFIDNPADQSFVRQYTLCSTCHEEQVDGFLQTAHGELQTASCIVCHDVHQPGGLMLDAKQLGNFDNAIYEQLCTECHERQTADFNLSVHAVTNSANCGSCHDMHKTDAFSRDPVTNELCLQCHGSFLLGFDTVEAIDFHTGPFMPVDPAGSGSSRCVKCHLPPLEQFQGEPVPHDHTLFTIPPLASNEAVAMGVTPAPPNSCNGVMGCHDPNVPGSGSPRDVNDLQLNLELQPVYESIGGDPREAPDV